MSPSKEELLERIEQQRRRIDELEAAMAGCAQIIDSSDRTPQTDAERRVLAMLVLVGEGGDESSPG